MGGTWPDLDASDLETRVRTYLHEATADFYTQAQIWRWLSLSAKDVAQKALCVRRILDAVTTASTRTVTTNVYKVLHVEYAPSTGRSQMLQKIMPLQVGHVKIDGITPQYWYEFGNAIGIEPIPTAAYNLRLYVADMPKMQHSTYPITTWEIPTWTGSGTGSWLGDATSNVFTGTTGEVGICTYSTALTASTNYTFIITLSGVTSCGLVITAGGTAGPTMSTAGTHAVNLTTATTTLTLTATMTGATGGLTVDDLYVLKESDFAGAGDQSELDPMWQHLMVLYAAAMGLYKSKHAGAAAMLESLYNNEIAYLRREVVDVIPDGKEAHKMQ